MKYLKLIIAFFPVLFLLSAQVLADNVPADKIGVIDVSKILQDSSQVKQLRDNLKARFKSRQSNLLQSENQLRSSLSKLERNRTVMSKKKIAQLQGDINRQQSSLGKMQSQFQHDFFMAQSKGMKKILDELRLDIEQVANKQGYDLVVIKNAVAYVRPENDITTKVQQFFK